MERRGLAAERGVTGNNTSDLGTGCRGEDGSKENLTPGWTNWVPIHIQGQCDQGILKNKWLWTRIEQEILGESGLI